MPSSSTQRESRFLQGVRIEDGIVVTRDLAQAARAEAILLVVPAQATRPVGRRWRARSHPARR